MQNIKYHILNTLSVIVFSFLLASTVNQFILYAIAPNQDFQPRKKKIVRQQSVSRNLEDYSLISDSGFFRIASAAASAEGALVAGGIMELQLLGTISGPPAIARALIKKNTEKDPEIFRLGGNVYGYKLVRIDNAKVYLKSSGSVEVIDMFAIPTQGAAGDPKQAIPGAASGRIRQTLSRSELQQKVLSNVDNALKGIRAAPYRLDDKIVGYRLLRVQPSSVLFKLGARSGDIVKRVNGHPVDSTEKLYQMWNSIQGESKITVDLERNGRLINYDFNITD